MKALLLVFFLALFGPAVFAQNWTPINPTYQYNYKIDPEGVITNVIFTDSISIEEGDSVFYLNRVMIEFDDFALRNQQQFLQKRMVKKSDELYVFEGIDTISLKPLAGLAETWQFSNGLEAQVTKIQAATIFGQSSLTKSITLSNDAELVLSECCGILSWTGIDSLDYQQVGIQGTTELGMQVPGFQDYYDFRVDDVLSHRFNTHDGVCSVSGYTSVTIIQQYLVELVISAPNTQEFLGYTEKNVYYGDFDYGPYSLRFTFADHASNAFPGECVSLSTVSNLSDDALNAVQFMEFLDSQNSHDEFFARCHLQSTEYGVDKLIGVPNYYYAPSQNSDTLWHYIGPSVDADECPYDSLAIVYREGLGDGILLNMGGYSYRRAFVGRSRDGEIVGECCSRWRYLSLTDIDPNAAIVVYPNPISRGQELHLNFPELFDQLRLYDSKGQLLINTELDYQSTVPINVPPGLYLLSLTGEQADKVQRLVVH